MSDYIPFDIQSDIFKRLPIKSLLQLRSVSKQWKSFIDNPEFIKNYHINNPKHHLLVQYNLNPKYTSIIDDKNTFPQQKFPLTNAPKYTLTLGSVDGLLCFYQDKTKMIVLWNPSIRKCVSIVIPNVMDLRFGYTIIGFGVCRDTSDPKLVKINVVESSICWEVQVFTLSSRVWRTVYKGLPFKYCDLKWDQVFIDGIIYWLTRDGRFIILFDLKSEKFGEVCIPVSSIRIYELRVVKVNESLGLLEYYYVEGGVSLCGVWMRKEGVNEPFTKIYTVKVEGESVFNRVLGFRNNGEVLLQLDDDYDFDGCQMQVYEPSSGRMNSVGISGQRLTFSAWSYMETLLLLDESDTIIH